VLHLIAAHHGRARPHFSAEEAFDPEHPDSVVRAAASEAPARFARLQRRYGRWGLAYLESLVRVADVVASQPQEAE
jgi:CRISPR-associated endonuclease/helicase Cas3